MVNRYAWGFGKMAPGTMGGESRLSTSPTRSGNQSTIKSSGSKSEGSDPPVTVTPPLPPSPEPEPDPTPPPDPPPGGFAFNLPVYTDDDVAAWLATGTEYTRLKNSWAGNVGRSAPTWGTQVPTSALQTLNEEGAYLKTQAVLYHAEINSGLTTLPASRLAKVTAMLDELNTLTSFQYDSVRQYKLTAGWFVTNLCQAAALVGYDPSDLSVFLNYCYDIMDWTTNPNWHASFADSKLAAACYLQDSALWDDAVAYFYERLDQQIYHSTYDGSTVVPMHNEDTQEQTRLHAPPGTPHLSRTLDHWGNNSKAVVQINTDYTPKNTASIPKVDGMYAERMRDLGHVNMGLGALMHGARTILAQGETLDTSAYNKLKAAYSYHSGRVLFHTQTGTYPVPVPISGLGGGNRFQGYHGAKKLFGVDTPANVLSMLARPEVTGYAPAGANHLVAEHFADA